MPLEKGPGTAERNIPELIHTYRRKGKIGNTKPRSAAHARLIAAAIAMKQERKG